MPLANLLDGLGGTLRPKVFCSQELVDQGAGLPNFGLYANRPRVEREAAGWVEPERGRFATQSRLRNDPCVKQGRAQQDQTDSFVWRIIEEVFDVGCATAVFWNNVVNGQIAELEG